MSGEIYDKKTISYTGTETVRINIQGFLSMGMDVSGTFTTGGFKVEGSNNGSTWSVMPTFDYTGEQISGGDITATGHYGFSCAGFAMARFTATGTPSYTVTASVLAIQAGLASGAGGGGDVTGVTASLPLGTNGTGTAPNVYVPGITGIGATAVLSVNAAGSAVPVIGTSGQYLSWSATGTASIISEVTNGTNIVAITSVGNVIRSTDAGVSFSQTATLPSPRGVSYGNSLYIATCASGGLYTSTDGITWTSRTSGVAVNLNAAVWDGTQFVVVGASGTVLTSPTGVTWTAQTFGVSTQIRWIAWTGSLLVAVGDSGMIRTSPTAVTWTARTSGVAVTIWDVTQDSLNGQVVAITNGGGVLTSPTGATWTVQTSGISTALYGVSVDSGVITAVGAGGVIITSPTGVTWTSRTSGVSTDLNDVLTLTDTFITVGNNGAILSSPTGTTWTLLSSAGPAFVTGEGTGIPLLKDGAKTINGAIDLTGAITYSGLTVSTPVYLNSSKVLTSGTFTGTGTTFVLSAGPTFTGTVVGAAANWSGNSVISGVLTIGGSANTRSGLRVLNTALVGTNQFGIELGPTFNSGATGIGRTLTLQFITEAAAFTMGVGRALFIEAPNIGATSAVTDYVALQIDNQGSRTAIMTGTGPVQFGDTVTTSSSYKSGNPSGGTALPWKFGSVITAASVLDTTRYVEADINGTAVKLALAA